MLKLQCKKISRIGINQPLLGEILVINILFPKVNDLKLLNAHILILLNLKFLVRFIRNAQPLEKEIKNPFPPIFWEEQDKHLLLMLITIIILYSKVEANLKVKASHLVDKNMKKYICPSEKMYILLTLLSVILMLTLIVLDQKPVLKLKKIVFTNVSKCLLQKWPSHYQHRRL